MKNFNLIVFVCMFSLLLSQPAFAETIELKSGKKITGRIIERTEDGIKIRVKNGVIKLKNDDIANFHNVERHSAAAFSIPTSSKPTSIAKHTTFASPSEKSANKKGVGKLTEGAHSGVQIIPKQSANLQLPFSFTAEQKKKLAEQVKQLLTSLGVKVNNPAILEEKIEEIEEIPLKLKTALKRIQPNKNEFLITFSLLMTFFFLFSVLILTISIKLAGGDISYLNALIFESKWIGVRTIFIISLFVIPFALEFLFSFLTGSLGANVAILGNVSSIVKVILALGSPILLFFLFVNIAQKNLLLSTGQVMAVIVVSLFLKLIFLIIVWVGIGPSLVDSVKSYFA